MGLVATANPHGIRPHAHHRASNQQLAPSKVAMFRWCSSARTNPFPSHEERCLAFLRPSRKFHEFARLAKCADEALQYSCSQVRLRLKHFAPSAATPQRGLPRPCTSPNNAEWQLRSFEQVLDPLGEPSSRHQRQRKHPFLPFQFFRRHPLLLAFPSIAVGHPLLLQAPPKPSLHPNRLRQ